MATDNPDLKDLRVAVVPVGVGVDQGSDVEEILENANTQLYSVADFFQAQNDEELPESYWTFLIDIVKKDDLTGSNTDGIDYFSQH